MDHKLFSVIIVLSTVVLFVLGVTTLLTLAAPLEAARANETIIYVDDDTCPDAGSGTQGNPYCQIQAGVDAATPDDEVRVAAGTYSDIHVRGGITQVVYISKTVIIRGGYTPTDWDASDPAANPTVIDAQGQGRGIAIDGSGSQWVTVDGFAITGGDTAESGGGVYAYQTTVTIANCNVHGNVASQNGGGIYLRYSGDATLTGNDVFSNTASNSGGGVCLSHYSDGATLTDSHVFSNTASNNGGGICIASSADATLTGSDVFSNTAGSHGGGIYLSRSDDATLTGNDIMGNRADRGGGVYLSSSGSATLTGNEVSGNTTDSYGGGLLLSGSHDPELRGNAIYENTAAGLYGGGIHFIGSDHAALAGNDILGNAAGFRGGGLFLDDSDDATLTNNVVVENRVIGGGDGAGGYVTNSTARFLHTTMARNKGKQGQGQGLYIDYGATLWMTNTILVDHTVGVEVASGATATLGCTLWGTDDWANEDDWEVNGTLVTDTLACNLWQEPDFVDPDGGDYHIGPGSGAIDAGVDAGVTVDIDGDSRIDYAPPDIGADELAPTTYKVHLPLVVRGW